MVAYTILTDRAAGMCIAGGTVDWSAFERDDRRLVVIGDAIVPRRVAHAIGEGRALAEALGVAAGALAAVA